MVTSRLVVVTSGEVLVKGRSVFVADFDNLLNLLGGKDFDVDVEVSGGEGLEWEGRSHL